MKKFQQYLEETAQTFDRPAVGDNFAINIREECLLETYVCDETADGIVLHADDRTWQLLEGYGLLGESVMGEADMVIQDIVSGEVNAQDVLDNPQTPSEQFVSRLLQRKLDQVSAEHDLDPVSDRDRVLEIAVNELANQYGHTSMDECAPAAVSIEYEPHQDAGEYDQEGDAAKDDLRTIIRSARRLLGILDDDENMPEWTQSKIDRAADYVDTAADYIESNREPESVTEGGARSLVAHDDEGAFAYKVYRDREWDEYVVKFYVNGQHQTEADYHTDDKNDAMSTAQQFLRYGPGGRTLDVMEAEYRGRDVPLGKPMRGDVKKSKVYVRGPKGNVVKVNFGDPNMRIKKSDPDRRKSFRARHNCDNPGPRWKARYWSCRAW